MKASFVLQSLWQTWLQITCSYFKLFEKVSLSFKKKKQQEKLKQGNFPKKNKKPQNKTRRQKAGAPSLFQLDDSDWGQSWVSVADSLTSGLLTKEDALFKHLSPACIIKRYRDSVVLRVGATATNK